MTGPGAVPDERPVPSYQEFAIGIALRRQRRSLRMSQEAVARQMGLSRASVTNFESGNQDVPLSKVVAYAEAVGMRLVPLPKEFLR